MARPIRIAGAGVSGLMAAIRLAQRGADVEIYERAPDSGANHAPRFDAIENWTTRADFHQVLSTWQIEIPIRQPEAVEVFDSRANCYRAAPERPLLYVARRGSEPDCLEQAMKRQALDLGVRLRYGTSLPPNEADLWAVGARAPGRFLAASLGFRTSHPDVVRVLVDRRLSPNAYAYLIVLDGHGTLSVVVTRQFKDARARLDDAVRAFRRLQPIEMIDIRAGGGTGGSLDAFRRPPTWTPNLGEAAGFQDYLWGFGIRLALQSGDLAARTLTEGTDYEESVAREISPMIEASIRLRMLYDRVGDPGDRMLIRRVATVRDPGAILRRSYEVAAARPVLWSTAYSRRPTRASAV
jgi:flavin-dependent dehydrogenase